MEICITKTIKRIFISGGVSLMLISCGGSSDPASDPSEVLSGIFTDAIVSGVSYVTETRSGFTNAKGEYDYVPGETVTFSIGGIVLGSSSAGPVVTPLSLVGTSDVTNPVAINIVRLLMSLDTDGNPNNGIQITEKTRNSATDAVIDFNLPLADFDKTGAVTRLISAAETSNVVLVDAATAQSHLTNTLATTWGLMDWGTGNWVIN